MPRFKVQYIGNWKARRTEGEIIDSECPAESDPTCAVVYDSPTGIQTELQPHGRTLGTLPDLQQALADARAGLLQYVNRLGTDAPDGLTVAAMSLWLLQKQDGTAMGCKL